MYNSLRADYDYVIDKNIIVITDLNFGRMSVTNNIEAVIQDLARTLQLDDKKIMDYSILYQDATGFFDQILLNDKGDFADFNILQEKQFEDAKKRIK